MAVVLERHSVMHRLRQGAFDRPSFTQASLKRSSLQAQADRPFSQDLGFSLVGQPDVSSCVSSLFSPCRPAHVARFVAFIVVYAVDRVLGCRTWTEMRPHIVRECDERATKGGPERDPSSPVIRVRRVRRIGASVDGVHPRSMKRCPRLTMYRLCGLQPLVSIASTRMCSAGSQIRLIQNTGCSAGTTTRPSGFSVRAFRCKAQKSPPAKHVARVQTDNCPRHVRPPESNAVKGRADVLASVRSVDYS